MIPVPRWLARPGFWVAVAAGLALASRRGLAAGVTGGAAVGLAVGALYLWLMVRRSLSLPGLPQRKALAAARIGAVLRFLFVFVGFAVAARMWSEANLAWAAAALLLPVVVGILAMARGA